MAKIWGNYKIMMDRILGLMVVVSCVLFERWPEKWVPVARKDKRL